MEVIVSQILSQNTIGNNDSDTVIIVKIPRIGGNNSDTI